MTDSDRSLGLAAAPVRILVYSDFQSSTAANGLAVLFEVYDRHPEDVQLVFRHFPVVSEYDKDSLAGQAAEAAGRQGLFWEMARALVRRHPEWSVLPPEAFRDWVRDPAAEIGLDAAQFAADLDGGRFAALMAEAFQDAVSLGIPGVPTILMNGEVLRISPTSLNLEAAVRLELLRRRQFPAAPAVTIDPAAGYTAYLETNVGEIVIQLLPGSAPQAVNSFVFLARQGWYDRTTVFRVEPGVLVEIGDPSATGFGDAGYHLPDEIDPAQTFAEAGVVALSSAGPGTGSSRILITLRPMPEWDGSRSIFGRVVAGLDILQGLAGRDPAQDLLAPGAAVLRRVRVEVRR